MNDTLEKIGTALIQHGPYNDRIYLMDLGDSDPERLTPALGKLAIRNGYSKIFAKVPASKAEPFLRHGYREEAAIPGLYQGTEDALFMCRYHNAERKHEPMMAVLDDIMVSARERQNAGNQKLLRTDAQLRKCTEADIGAMAQIYATVFPSYPFPIQNPDYLLETMQSHVDYFGIEIAGKLVALSSAEMNPKAQSVEMTDFATLPAFLGNGFAVHLLAAMESAMRKRGIKTAYTIARAASPGMNITFARLGYAYDGRLINNTQISGHIESMNVWHKPLN
ncbi:MAG: putative beta-lysine N-acetyltransferase [Verrucomicrobiota bacterium]|nr:putative beta-lysine N-acetyltransferase [Verrucomicrobiota bacterium]